MGKINNYFGIALILTISSLGESCNDSRLAKDIEGTWTSSYVTSYEDGTKSYIDEQVTFTNDDPAKNGGTFIEIRTGKEEIDEDELNTKYSWVSKIEGTWEINIEDLVLHYNVSTLEVEIGKEDVDYNFKGEAFLWNDWGSLIIGGMYMKENLYKELKKETYRQMFRYYKGINNGTENNGVSFSEVQIHGSVLSYETADMGRIKYYRVKNKKLIKQKKDNNVEDNPNDLKDVSSSDEESGYSHHLSGYIDKYQIYMFINIEDDGTVSGYYYYDSQGTESKIYLSGQYRQTDDTNRMILECDNQDVFDGYIDETDYSGEFTNSSNIRLDFNLYMQN